MCIKLLQKKNEFLIRILIYIYKFMKNNISHDSIQCIRYLFIEQGH